MSARVYSSGCTGLTLMLLFWGLLCEARAQTIPCEYPTGPGPASVEVGPNGELIYVPEPNGDTIPDFSNAGFAGGGLAIPPVPVVTILRPVAGDNSSQIQQAIDDLAQTPIGPDGFRGAVLLEAGVYELQSGLVIRDSGIVLYGAGDGSDGTVLRLVASGGPTIRVTDGGQRSQEVRGTRHRLVDDYVPVGANWFRLDSIAGLAVGDTVLVVRPSTANWIHDIGMDVNGHNWRAGQFDVKWDRVIVAIEGDRVLLDAPLTQALDQNYGGGYAFKYVFPNRLENVGIENLRADATIGVDELGNTGGSFITLEGLMNGWVRQVTNDRMRGHTVLVHGGKWITVQDVTSFHNPLPGGHHGASIQIHTLTGGAQFVLFHRIVASDGGFEFSSGGGPVPGPNVFLECRVPHGFAFSGPHMKWAVGTLYDSLRLRHGLAVLLNGGSHGWAGANHLAWNVETTGFHFDRPPTAHQWIIGGIAPRRPDPPRRGALPAEVLSFGQHVDPASLYRAQLAERLGEEAVLGALGPPPGNP